MGAALSSSVADWVTSMSNGLSIVPRGKDADAPKMDKRLPDTVERWAQVARLAELGMMMSSLVHELRQPLFAIKTLAELQAQDSTGDAARQMSRLLDQVRHLEDLIDHYGGLGRWSHDAHPFAVADVVEFVVTTLRRKAQKRRIALVWSGDLDGLTMVGSVTAVRQLLLNLVQNAVDAIGDAEERRVEIGVEVLDDDFVRFTVHDSGPGIPRSEARRVFEPFVTSKPEGEGTGLGLFLVKLLAMQMDGLVRLDNPGQPGARFIVELPRRP